MCNEDLLKSLIAHFRAGVAFHEEAADIFGFLSLLSYQREQEDQACEEYERYRAFNSYCLLNYNKLLQVEDIPVLHLIPLSWYQYSREEVDSTTRIKAVRECLKGWVDWEEKTIEILQDAHKKLYELGDIATTLKIGEYIREVQQELQRARNQYIRLESCVYDITVILADNVGEVNDTINST